MGTIEALKPYESAWQDAVEIIHHRRLSDSLIKRQMMEAAERYNGSVVFPLPDVEGEPTFPAIASSIIADSIDSFATRANDTVPTITAPALKPTAKSYRDRAELRRHAWAATWYESQLDIRLGRALRQYFGYGTFGFHVVPNHVTHRPIIESRDPLLSYPEPMGNDEIRLPRNIGYVYGRSPSWLKRNYPESAALIDANSSSDDDLWDVLDWTDENNCMIGILGKRGFDSFNQRYDQLGRYSHFGDQPLDQALLLARYPNRAGGLVPAICPTAVTLDRLVSSITRIVPITDLMNKVAALNFISAEKGVFPHLVVLGDNGAEPTITGGQFKDGRTGEANLIQNAKAVQALNLGPSSQTQVLMSDLERAARHASGTPSMLQGELTGSLRSGQTVNQLAGIAIDPSIKEAHNVMGYTLAAMNDAVAEVQKGYWPRREYTVFSGWPGSNRHVTYKPADIFTETTKSVVAYPMPGLDAQGATIVLGQLNQMRAISRRTLRSLHPLISDGDNQETELMEEALDDAISMTAVGLVTSGQLAWTDLSVIRGKLRQGMPIEEAIAAAQKEAQERQATQAPEPAQPEMAMPPEAMPGLNAPEAGGQMAPPTTPEAPPAGQEAQFEQIAQALMAQPGGGAPAGAGAAA